MFWIRLLLFLSRLKPSNVHRRFLVLYQKRFYFLKRINIASFASQLQCTGMAVVPMNDTMNCVILNTDVETIDATYTHLPTPLAKIPNFTFYIYTERQGKGNNFGHYANIALDEKQI